MPRNGSGTFTLAEPPFVPQTPISSAAVNSDFSDIAAALTGSLARDGQGGMTAELPLANAGFSYTSDPNTGMHRTGADAQAIECGGVDVVEIETTGATVNGALEVTGPITSGGVAILPIGLGPLPWSGLTAPPKWVLCYGQSLLRASYPDLWTFASGEIAGGNTLYTNGDGSTTFTVPDMRGRIPGGKDNMGGVAANRLTSTTITPDGNTLGAISPNTSQTVALSLAQLPTGITSTVNTTLANNVVTADAQPTSFSASPGAVVFKAFSNATTVSTVASMAGSGTATSNNTSGAVHNNVQPTIITNYILYAGA